MTDLTSSAASLRNALVPLGGLGSGSTRAEARGILDPLAGLVAGLIAAPLARWRAAAQGRRAKRQLLALDERMLKDIGYTRADVLWYAVRHAADPDLMVRSGHARD